MPRPRDRLCRSCGEPSVGIRCRDCHHGVKKPQLVKSRVYYKVNGALPHTSYTAGLIRPTSSDSILDNKPPLAITVV
jgi:hypothetical protein